MLDKLERSNLFLVPLDNERRWYRYHHLFADALRQHLHQRSTASTGDAEGDVTALHRRASQWYEDNGLDLDAFHHAGAAQDVERAERLIEGEGVPLYFRGAGAPVLNWLESLPAAVLNARPSLWLTYAAALMTTGHHTAVEQKLQEADAALHGADPDDRTSDLIGRIASMRATAAVIQHDADTIMTQSRRALEYLSPTNLPLRTATTWTLGYAYQLQGDRAAARQSYADVLASSTLFGDSIYTIAATLSLGQVQEADTQLSLAAETYRRVLLLAGDPPQPIACEAHLGLARIAYQWNDLNAAQQHGQHCLHLTRQMDSLDTFAGCGVFLARLKLAQGDVPGAVTVLAEAAALVRQHNFAFRLPDVMAAQVLTLLRQGRLAAAAQLAQTQDLPLSQARVHLAHGDPSTALAVLSPWCQHVEAKEWVDERLTVLVLQALAHHAQGDTDTAMHRLGDALALAEPGGFIRLFVDEGRPMAQLLSEAAAHGMMPAYTGKVLAVCDAEHQRRAGAAPRPTAPASQSLIEPLSQRERDVLRLFKSDLSGPEIARELVVALSTVRTHTKSIYGKLNVTNRRAAVKRAADLHLL